MDNPADKAYKSCPSLWIAWGEISPKRCASLSERRVRLGERAAFRPALADGSGVDQALIQAEPLCQAHTEIVLAQALAADHMIKAVQVLLEHADQNI